MRRYGIYNSQLQLQANIKGGQNEPLVTLGNPCDIATNATFVIFKKGGKMLFFSFHKIGPNV